MHRLNVLGGLSLQSTTGPLAGRAVQRRRLALLALLAAAPSGSFSRDKLIAYLWPDANAENGRAFLSDSVYRINKALGDVIVAAGDVLRLDTGLLASDLAEFEDAVARGDQARAVEAYAGPFLDGFFLPDAPEFERWADSEREQRSREHARAMEALAEAAEQGAQPIVAVEWWRRLAALDPLDSRVALRLMRALDAAGQRAAAIQHAQVHRALLQAELGIDPDASVEQLAERLRAEPIRPRLEGTGDAAAPAPRGAPVPDEAPTLEVAPIERPGSPPEQVALETARVRSVTSVAGAGPAAQRRGVWRWWAAAAAILGTIALAAMLWRTSPDAAAARAPQARTIAVLPFANLSPDRNDEYFSDGITEELISTLARVEGVDVASRTSSFAFKHRPEDIREVGRKLGVRTIVEGSVRRSGTRLRITARLVDAADGKPLWSGEYDRQMQDALAIQEELSRAIVSKLTGSLLGAGRARFAMRPTHDPEAYDLYLKGRHAWHRRTPEGLQQSIELFERAVARAPDYARAHVGLADAYAVSAFYDYRAPIEAYPRAEAAARNALRIDPTLAAAHATLGYVHTYYHLDFPRAEREFERAIELDAGYSTAHQWYANLLTVASRFDQAAREMRTAEEVDPLSIVAQAALAWSLYHGGRHEAALEQARRTLDLDSGFVLARMWGAWALEALGRPDEAQRWLAESVRLSNDALLPRLALARHLAGSARSSSRDSARAVARDMDRRRAAGEYLPSYEIGKLHLALGDTLVGFSWLERAYRERSHSRAIALVDPQLAPLRGDPRFRRLVQGASGTGR